MRLKLLVQLSPCSLIVRLIIDLIVANTRLVETTVKPLSNSQSRNLPASDVLYALKTA